VPGANQYLCDLLNLKSIDEMIGDFITFQEVEPAVSSTELHELATRILAYNDGDMNKAIFSARNILNTIPKSLDDLVDYTTKERLEEFTSMVIGSSIVGIGKDPKDYNSLDKLSVLLEGELFGVVDIICNAQMDHSRKTEMDDQPGITERQRMLFSAANYYLNHRIGFKCNTMWLACFLSSNSFGCQSGWFHNDGGLCHATHFGFKDDDGMIGAVISSFTFISDFFHAARSEEDSERAETASNYMTTLLFSLDALAKRRIIDNSSDDEKSFHDLAELINNNDDFLCSGDKLFFLTTLMSQRDEEGFTNDHINLLKETIYSHDNSEAPPKHQLPQFDACNFMAFDANYVKSYKLAAMFLKAKYDEKALMDFSATLVEHLQEENLPDQYDSLLRGFFQNYLFILVNENSDSMFMFDGILKTVVSSRKIIKDLDVGDVVRSMAELGHAPSIIEMTSKTKGAESSYWVDRYDLVTADVS
jgi:hypothetical protein